MLAVLTRMRAAWEWFSFANEVVSGLGLLQRGAAATAVTAALAAPVVAFNSGKATVTERTIIEKSAPAAAYQLPPAEYWANEPDRVFHYSYLVEHREVLSYILATCKSGAEGNMARCEQAGSAAAAIRMDENRRKFHQAIDRLNK